jgi:hypothetical protein
MRNAGYNWLILSVALISPEPAVLCLDKINPYFMINILQKRFRIANFNLKTIIPKFIAICFLLILFAVVCRLTIVLVLGLVNK